MVEAEGQHVADGEADDPVSDDLDDEAGVGVACSAKGSGGGDLEAVELEESGYEEERDGRGDHVRVGCEGSGDVVGGEEEDGGEGGHAGGSEEDRGPACGSGFLWGVAADGLTYTDGGGGGDGEGNHEGEGGTVEGDFVAGEWERANGADKEGNEGEDGDLDEDLAAGGCSEEGKTSEASALDVTEHGAEAIVVLVLNAPYGCGYEER